MIKAINSDLLSEQKIDNKTYLFELLNFHLSLREVQDKIAVNSFVRLEKVLQTDLPENTTIITPVLGKGLTRWFCIVKTSSISHQVSLAKTAELAPVVGSKRCAIILNDTYRNCAIG